MTRTLEDLYRTYAPALRSTAYKTTHDWDDADDIVAETFLVAHRKLDQLQSGPGWLWLKAIMRNILGSWIRKKKAVTDGLEPEGRRLWPIDNDLDPEAACIANETIRECLRILTPGQAEAIALVHLEGLTLKEAAARLGIKLNALHLRLTRGQRRLKKCLSQTGDSKQ